MNHFNQFSTIQTGSPKQWTHSNANQREYNTNCSGDGGGSSCRKEMVVEKKLCTQHKELWKYRTVSFSLRVYAYTQYIPRFTGVCWCCGFSFCFVLFLVLFLSVITVNEMLHERIKYVECERHPIKYRVKEIVTEPWFFPSAGGTPVCYGIICIVCCCEFFSLASLEEWKWKYWRSEKKQQPTKPNHHSMFRTCVCLCVCVPRFECVWNVYTTTDKES